MRDDQFVTGLDNASRVLLRLPAAQARQLTIALNKGVTEIAAAAKLLAPTDGPPRVLADNIRVEPVSRRAATRRRTEALSARVFVARNPAFFARFLEFGTVKLAARPFFFVAVAALRRRVRARVVRALTRGAREAVRGR